MQHFGAFCQDFVPVSDMSAHRQVLLPPITLEGFTIARLVLDTCPLPDTLQGLCQA